MSSLIFFLFSVIFYSIVTFPQLFLNCRNKTAKGIDTLFISLWIYADYFTLISVIRKELSIAIISLSIFHVLCTILLIIQKLYYGNHTNCNLYLFIPVVLSGILTFFVFWNPTLLFADLVGWISCALYIIAPIPQIIYNFKRKSVDGLSSLLFIFLIIANGFLLASIFSEESIFPYLQIIVTDIITSVLYIIICMQFLFLPETGGGVN